MAAIPLFDEETAFAAMKAVAKRKRDAELGWMSYAQLMSLAPNLSEMHRRLSDRLADSGVDPVSLKYTKELIRYLNAGVRLKELGVVPGLDIAREYHRSGLSSNVKVCHCRCKLDMNHVETSCAQENIIQVLKGNAPEPVTIRGSVFVDVCRGHASPAERKVPVSYKDALCGILGPFLNTLGQDSTCIVFRGARTYLTVSDMIERVRRASS